MVEFALFFRLESPSLAIVAKALVVSLLLAGIRVRLTPPVDQPRQLSLSLMAESDLSLHGMTSFAQRLCRACSTASPEGVTLPGLTDTGRLHSQDRVVIRL